MRDSIAERIGQIRTELSPSVRLIAVTKTVGVAAIREAYGAGVRDFGENRLQEALPKLEALRDLRDIRWHFIGHLQANKAKKALEQFDWIHTCDSLKLARRLDRLAAEVGRSPVVCLQVKPLPDPDKYGFTFDELLDGLPDLEACESLNVRGLMTILPLGLNETQRHEAFVSVRELASKMAQSSGQHWPMPELSMGMSGDYRLAVAAGATAVRLGRTIFGERQKSD